jgi:hypothetical protein
LGKVTDTKKKKKQEECRQEEKEEQRRILEHTQMLQDGQVNLKNETNEL